MKKIINPISTSDLEKEINKDTFIRKTNYCNHEIYIVDYHNHINTTMEIGRLRELSFRNAGGGTGKSYDLDEFDTSENCYDQLIVWSPEDEEIIGGYRFILCQKVLADRENIELSTAHYFSFTDQFIDNYLPNTIELGRSWVQPNFQPTVNPRKGLFALDNIWDGLGAIVKTHLEIMYFFGKVTMYPTYNEEARDFLLHFMHYYFPDSDQLMKPFRPLEQDYDSAECDSLLKGLDFKEGFKVLNAYVKERGEYIPPLVNIYMNLSPSMKTFGTAVNPEFGNVEETGILVPFADIYQEKKDRYMTY